MREMPDSLADALPRAADHELAGLAKAFGHPVLLRDAGLVQGTVAGPQVRSCANRGRLEELSELLGGLP